MSLGDFVLFIDWVPMCPGHSDSVVRGWIFGLISYKLPIFVAERKIWRLIQLECRRGTNVDRTR